MHVNYHRRDRLLIVLLLAILVGLPAGIWTYERAFWRRQIPSDTKVFTLTGHTDRGWISGVVKAYDILSFGDKSIPVNKPIIRVKKGDRVVFKLKSSDVVHGFSLKELGIFIAEGIPPGKVQMVSFVADREGTFTFSCNAICGPNHEKMQGTLVVTA